MLTRGIRNFNPANIRRSSSNWKGLSSVQSDVQFCVFDSFEYGVRALICLIRTYYNKYHLCSISEIISRFAPPSENATSQYISYVSSQVGLPPDSYVCLSFNTSPSDNQRTLYKLCSSICFIESNFQLSYDLFLKSLSLL